MVKSNSFEHGLHTRTHYAIELSTDAQRMPNVGKRESDLVLDLSEGRTITRKAAGVQEMHV